MPAAQQDVVRELALVELVVYLMVAQQRDVELAKRTLCGVEYPGEG